MLLIIGVRERSGYFWGHDSGYDSRFILRRLSKCFLYWKQRIFFFFFSSIWPNIICLALRCLEAGRQTERTTAQAGDSIRIQSSICNCSSWKVDVRGVRQRRLKSFASPVVHTDKVTFIQSSLWTPLLGRWLMMEWQGRWRTHRPGRLCIRMCGRVKSRAPSEECRSGNARWLCDHKPDWPWRFPARVKG